MRRISGETGRHRTGIPYMNQEMNTILSEVERETNDYSLTAEHLFRPHGADAHQAPD